MKEYDITALGECLIDFTPAGVSPAGMLLFERNPGGAPANMLVCAAKMGRRVAFIGKVGRDMHGRFLRQTLEDAGVDLRGLRMTDRAFTTLAFVTLNEVGERSFSFARQPGADTQLTVDELDESLLRNTKIFHFGSLSMTDASIGRTTLVALAVAKEAGALISYDPNYRPLLWESAEVAQEQIRSVLSQVDAIKISDDECEITTGCADLDKGAAFLLEQGISCVVITLGARGARIFTSRGDCVARGYAPAIMVDSTGAGDAFWGSFLTRLAELEVHPRDLTLAQLQEIGEFSCAAASLSVEKRGAIPAMPDRQGAALRWAQV